MESTLSNYDGSAATPVAEQSVRRFFANMLFGSGTEVTFPDTWQEAKVDRFFLTLSNPAPVVNASGELCVEDAADSMDDLFGDFEWD